MKLGSGEYLGRIVRRQVLAGLHLVEARYTPGYALPSHSHNQAYFCSIRRGGYEEYYGSRSRTCRPGVLAFHPAGERHSQHMGSIMVVSFNVEVDAVWAA